MFGQWRACVAGREGRSGFVARLRHFDGIWSRANALRMHHHRAAGTRPSTFPPPIARRHGVPHAAAARARLVARLPLEGADRPDRGGANRQFRHRGRDRAHRAGRRRRARSPARRCCRSSISTAARRGRAPRRRAAARDRWRRRLGARRVYSMALNASYEIDFWGKNRANSRAAQENAIAARFDRDVVAREHRGQRRHRLFPGGCRRRSGCGLARENLAAAERVLDLIMQRFDAGTASAARRRAAGKPGRNACARRSRRSTRSLRQNMAALALLVGRAPAYLKVRGGSLYQLGIPRVTPGLPSELLLQRPDIRAAEAQPRRPPTPASKRRAPPSSRSSRSPANTASPARR